jgi:hypothetical protein
VKIVAKIVVIVQKEVAQKDVAEVIEDIEVTRVTRVIRKGDAQDVELNLSI